MSNHKARALAVGILILLAYVLLVSNNPNQKTLSMFLEITGGVSVLGIAILYPKFLYSIIPIILNEVVLAFWLIIKGFNDEKYNNT